MLMRADHSTLLVIDIQERLCPALHNAEALVENSAWLIQVARRMNVPVLVSEQYPKGLGPTVAALRPLLEGIEPVEKLRFSTAREKALLAQPGGERRQFVVCGAETHVCVLQTVLELLELGREVFVVEEAVTSRTPANKQLALERMRQAGAEIVSREMVAFEWLDKAGSELFKEISKMVR
ncbi:MAG TPA: hydrolase [Pseudomonas sp.]|jgi:nicotinamidase-related amidase|nr:hydrolase [Pseudomonas sp.]